MSTPRRQQLYDHRLVQLVQRTRDISHATGCGVPASTARGWIARDAIEVISHPAFDMATDDLRVRLARLDARLARLGALLRVALALLAVLRPDFARLRIAEGRDKQRLLRAIHRGRSTPNLTRMLRAIGLSPSRLSVWRRAAAGCELDDAESCPNFSPHALTRDEIASIKHLVTAPAYRHVPTGRLALLAQGLRHVFASPSTWHRLVKRFGWRRPGLRLHPGKPREGIRAEKPDGVWHVDTTVIRLLDGTKTYLQAVIDNFSRRILAWRVNDTFDPGVTAELLVEAGAEQLDATPEELVDAGVENMNHRVDGLVERGLLRRVLAMVDISFSNSLIEAWWRSLKHNWLFLHPLDTTATVRREVAFYVEQHNSVIPHHAFKGQPPDEVYFGRGDEVPNQLADARVRRMEANRARRCAVCA